MLLIDGYNVLFKTDAKGDFRAARERLVRQIDSYCGRTGQRARIYFDSKDGPLRGRTADVEVFYTAAGETADAAILRALEESPDRTAYRVVSSDRAIAEAARRRKVAVTGSEEFLREIAPPRIEGEKPVEISDGEVDYWKRTFGVGGDKP